MTLGNWLESWYTLYVTESELAPSTMAMYRRAINAVPPSLAGVELEELTGLHIHQWLTQVRKETPRAAQLDRIMLSRALKVAAKNRLCPPDIIDPDTVPKPRYTSPEVAVMTRPQLMAYIEAAKTTDVALLLLLGACGLRRGEMLGVRWEDIDLDQGTIHIQRQRMRCNHQYTARPLKTRASNRILYMPDMLLQLLTTWPRHYRGWLVDTTPEHLREVHNAIVTRLSLPPVTLHGLRHTFATMAAEAAPITQVQHALGHGTIKLTASLYCAHMPTPVRTAKALFAYA